MPTLLYFLMLSRLNGWNAKLNQFLMIFDNILLCMKNDFYEWKELAFLLVFSTITCIVRYLNRQKQENIMNTANSSGVTAQLHYDSYGEGNLGITHWSVTEVSHPAGVGKSVTKSYQTNSWDRMCQIKLFLFYFSLVPAGGVSATTSSLVWC